MDMVSLLLARQPPDLLPAPAVAAGLVLCFPHPRGHLRVAFERHRAGIEGNRNLELGDKPLEAPHASPRAVLEDRFGREVSILRVHRVNDLLEAVVALVAGGVGIFYPLLVVENHADPDEGFTRPPHTRTLSPVTNTASSLPRVSNLTLPAN